MQGRGVRARNLDTVNSRLRSGLGNPGAELSLVDAAGEIAGEEVEPR